MKSDGLPEPMPPVAERLVAPVAERLIALDALRGAALFGVLLVNLDSDFRVSLFQRMLTPHTHAGWFNYTADLLIVSVFEFKAFTLFAFLFGVGVAIQTERLTHAPARFLARRFGLLLFIGLSHMLLIWNGDILTLYAVCGLLLIPLVKLPARWLAVFGLALIVVAPYLPFFNAFFPAHEAIQQHAAIAMHVYATGSFTEIMTLRWHEAWRFIAPLLIGSLPRTLGLMLCGNAAWRSGVFQNTAQHRAVLRFIGCLTGTLGAWLTIWSLWAKETGRELPATLEWLTPYDFVLLACAYGAGLWLWLSRTPSKAACWLAAGGRMALSNYLAQSVIFSLMFYGFGLGWFGKLGSAITLLLGVAVFIAQLIVSDWWLRRYPYGPAEWLWRSLTYGRWQLV